MLNIPLQTIPNQSFSLQLNGNTYDIILRDCGNIMASSVAINNVQITANLRIVPSIFLLPYRYLENGNFLITTEDENQEYADWRRFGLGQTMVFATQAELNEIRFFQNSSVNRAAIT